MGTISSDDLDLLAQTLRKTMAASSGADLDKSLADLGWHEMLVEMPETAIPLMFKLLGETGSHAPVLNDVVLHEAGLPAGESIALPFAGGSWVVWERTDQPTSAIDDQLPIRRVDGADTVPLAGARRALGWWLVGISRAMLNVARRHAVDRNQFGRPVASFQAIQHRLAETLVAIEGAEDTLAAAGADDLSSLLAKAAAGHAALTAARHCQQVLGGIGFTAEHGFHRHVRRALVLDGLLGSTRELTREAGAELRRRRFAPRLTDL